MGFLCASYCCYPRTVLSLEQGLMILFVLGDGREHGGSVAAQSVSVFISAALRPPMLLRALSEDTAVDPSQARHCQGQSGVRTLSRDTGL